MDSGQSGQAAGWARFRAAFTVFRDVAVTILALHGVWHQEHSGRVNPWLLLMYAVMLALIPASHAVALLRGPAAGPPQPSSAQPPAPVTAGPPS